MQYTVNAAYLDLLLLCKGSGLFCLVLALYSIKKELLEFADWSLQMRGYGL